MIFFLMAFMIQTIKMKNEYSIRCDAIEKTLFYSKQNISYDINHFVCKKYLAKATILMRSNRGTIRKIDKLITNAKKIIIENTTEYADVRLQYYLVCAWYYALVQDDKDMAKYLSNALELSNVIIPTDLQKIEDVIIPLRQYLL